MALDNFRAQQITWDKASRKIYEDIRANQSDARGRKLVVQVINDGVVEMLSGVGLILRWKSKNGTGKGYDNFTVLDASKGLFELYYTTGMLSNVGVLEAFLELNDATGRVISEPFNITVTRGVDDSAIEGSDSFTALAEAMVTISRFEEGLAKAIRKDDTGVLSLSVFDDETRAAIQGIAPGSINAVLGYRNVKPENTSFLDVGKNIYDKNTITPLTTIIPSNGSITTSSANTTSKKTPILPNAKYFMSDTQGSTVTVGFYKEGDVFISASQQAGNSVITTPNGTSYAIFAVRQDKVDTFQVEKGEAPSAYAPYGYQLDKKISVDVDDGKFLKKDIFKKQLPLADGSISEFGQDAIGPNRVRTIGLVSVNAGTVLSLKNPADYQYAIYDSTGSIAFAWVNNKIVFEKDATIRVMIRNIPPERNVTIEEAQEQIIIRNSDHVALLSDIGGSSEVKSGIKYISPTGLDTNNGNTLSSAYLTLQKAVESGATTVYAKRGDYFNQRFTAVAKKLTILPVSSQTYNEKPIGKIRFIGADKLDGLVASDGILSKTMPAGRNFTQVFIEKTLPLIGSGSRPQYNVLLWEVFDDFKKDYIMKPVLSVQEVRDEQGTFFWDGSKIHINPKGTNTSFYVPSVNVGLDFSNVSELKAVDLVADFNVITPFNLDNVTSFYLKNCEANHSGISDGFSIDYANGTFENCKAYKNRNDGFNMHFYGDTTLINCYGLHNYDDGVSHHEYTTGTIIGGEYSWNGKAGSAPVLNTKVNMYDVWLEGNDYGILSSGASEGNVFKGNITKGNRVGISNNVPNTRFVDNKFSGNVSDIVGEVNQIS